MGNHMPKLEPNDSKSATQPITCLDAKFRWTGITGHCAEVKRQHYPLCCQGIVFLKLGESDAGSNAKKSENGNQGELSDPPNMIKGVSVLNIRPSW